MTAQEPPGRTPPPLLRPSPPAEPVPDHDTERFFLDVVRQIGRETGLSPLFLTPLPTPDIEVRLWHGFGLGGVHAVIARRERGVWSAVRLEPVIGGDPDRIQYRRLPLPPLDWADLWRAANAAGLDSLAPVPMRDPTLIINDGNSYVLEWRVGRVYRTAVYSNPDAFRNPDDERMERVASAILDPVSAAMKSASRSTTHN